MRGHLPVTALAVAACFIVLADAPSAEEAGQPPRSTATEQASAGSQEANTWTTVLDNRDVQGVLGKKVRSSTRENLGYVVNVLVDQGGQVRGAVIEAGGFLGVGSRQVVVDWSALHFDPGSDGNDIMLDLTWDQVKAAPEYKNGKPVVVLGALGASFAPDM